MRMKAGVWLLGGFLLGIALGGAWRAASRDQAAGQASSAAKQKTALAQSGGVVVPEANGSAGGNPEKIEVNSAELTRMLEWGNGRDTAVSAEQQLSGSSDMEQKLRVLGEWAELEESQLPILTEILRRAAEERMAWEKSHVRVEAVAGQAGTWILHYPPEDGALHAKLLRDLSARFSPEEVAALDLAGDLSNFSYSRFLKRTLENVRVKVTTVRVDSKPNPAGDFVRIQATALPGEDAEKIDWPVHALGDTDQPAGRFLRLLGSKEEILRTATEAAGRSGGKNHE